MSFLALVWQVMQLLSGAAAKTAEAEVKRIKAGMNATSDFGTILVIGFAPAPNRSSVFCYAISICLWCSQGFCIRNSATVKRMQPAAAAG
jgi:hypothetical protein